MTDTPRYLDGFLAAVRPGSGRAAGNPAESNARSEPATLPAPPVAPAREENFSAEEQIKRRLHPLDSFLRLLECVETNRPPDAEDRFRFQWFGLFYQAPRQDAFLLRLRLPGGRLEGFQLAGLAGIIQECAGGHLLLNPQGGLDIPGVPVRAAAEILRRTEGIGLSARQTGGHCVHAIRGGEDEGLMTDHPRALVYPLVCALEQALMHHRALADLPGGCEIVFQGADESSATGQAWDKDTIFLRTVTTPQFLPDGVAVTSHPPAFLLAVPGGLEGGFLLSPSRAVAGCLKLLEAWAAGADRTDGQRGGLAAFCRALGSEKIRGLLESAPWQPDLTQSRTETLVTSGNLTPGFVIPEGRLLSGQLVSISKIARDHGLADIRLFRGCLHTVQAIDDAARVAINSALASG